MMTDWNDLLHKEKQKPYFRSLIERVREAQSTGSIVYPQNEDIFNAFKYTPFQSLKVVIMGQDPYHGPNQAHGLSFSVQPGIKKPPSLVNIFKELHRDLGITIPDSGCLTQWAKQGVLLLNETLTVAQGEPGAHQKWGWSNFTETVITTINEHATGIVFLLWGSHAQKHAKHIDATKHPILTTTHPSPLSAHRGFLGCGHFSKTNMLLEKQGKTPINWAL
jgi:uracil-DNA glycosylase